jgi:hypothetical protein
VPLKTGQTASWSPVDWRATVITWKVISTPDGELNTPASYWNPLDLRAGECR